MGNVLWSREEALASVAAVEMLPMPAMADGDGDDGPAYLVGGGTGSTDVAEQFFRRLKHHWNQGQTWEFLLSFTSHSIKYCTVVWLNWFLGFYHLAKLLCNFKKKTCHKFIKLKMLGHLALHDGQALSRDKGRQDADRRRGQRQPRPQ